MPGPVFAVTLAKGYQSRDAGIGVALGHGIVEIPLVAIIYFGFARFFDSGLVKIILGIAGGSILIYMGSGMFRRHNKESEGVHSLSQGSITAGFLTTASNAYFFLWWITIGAALMTKAITFGVVGILLFVLVHWLCDLTWCSLVSLTVYKTKRLWSGRLRQIIFGLCGAILIGFGGWFIVSVVRGL